VDLEGHYSLFTYTSQHMALLVGIEATLEVCIGNGNSHFPTESHKNGNGHGVVQEREWEWELLHGNGSEKNPFQQISTLYCVVMWRTDQATNCVLQTVVYCVFKIGAVSVQCACPVVCRLNCELRDVRILCVCCLAVYSYCSAG